LGKVLKFCADSITPIITHIFNKCLSSSQIPDEWKCAVVTALYKNKGDRENCDNYRGISVISPIGKIFEKLIGKQILIYFDNNGLFTRNQHGFRRNFSCATALQSLIDNWVFFKFNY
jgi:hypothetical protein